MRIATAILCLAAAGALAGCSGGRVRQAVAPPRGPEITSRDIGEAAVTGTRHYQATGKGPVYLATGSLHGETVAKIDGEISVEAIDRASQDDLVQNEAAGAAGDKALVTGWFKTHDGARFDFAVTEIEPVAPTGPDPGFSTRFGGVATDVVLFGDTGFGTPQMPKVKAGAAIWARGAFRKDGEDVGEFPVQVFVTSRTRSVETGRTLGERDATARPPEEIHLLVNAPATLENLTLGGKRIEVTTVPAGTGKVPPMHVIWASSEVRFAY